MLTPPLPVNQKQYRHSISMQQQTRESLLIGTALLLLKQHSRVPRDRRRDNDTDEIGLASWKQYRYTHGEGFDRDVTPDLSILKGMCVRRSTDYAKHQIRVKPHSPDPLAPPTPAGEIPAVPCPIET